MAAKTERSSQTRVSSLLLGTLLLTCALGAVLRVYKLGAESIWLDEAFTIQTSHGSLAQIVEATAKDVHPPLYYFAMHYWMQLFGDTEFSTRLLSTLFGVLTILAIYKLASLLYNRTTGLVAALLLALSGFHIEFSQEARMYTLLCLLCLLSMYFFTKLLAGRKSLFALAGYIASSALLMYTHVYSIFILAAQNLYWLSLPFISREIFKQVWKRWLLAQAALVVLFLPWLTVLVQQVSRVQKGFWIPRLPSRALFDTLVTYAGSGALAWILFPMAALAIFLGWKGLTEEGANGAPPAKSQEGLLESRLKTYLLLLWLVCPIILPFILSQFSSPIFLPKYTIPASLAFIILAARGFLSVRFHQLRMLLVLLIACFTLIDLRNYYGAVKKDVWRDAVANFEQLAQPGDVVLFNEPPGQRPFDYYSKRTDLIKKPFPDYSSELRADNISELLKPTVEGQDRVWLVLSHPGTFTPLIAEQLKEWYIVAAHRIEPGVEIYLFEKRR
jgi:mannosyltransferase